MIEAWLTFNGERVLRGAAVGGKAHWEAIDLGDEAAGLLLDAVAKAWMEICGDCRPADAAAIVTTLELLSVDLDLDLEVGEAALQALG